MEPGALLAGRFEILALAGEGGMAEVWRATDRLTGEQVAVKALKEPGLAEPERFTREARVLAELRHPGIVRYVAHGVTDAREAWLAMEWLEGETLSDRLARQGLTMAESLALVRRVAEALSAAHAHGVIHRDIKPDNVFLPGAALDRARVLDFGIARHRRGTHAPTRTGTVLGTPGYMAPEQVRGDRALDPRADLFSLGCVLFECLTGQEPFPGESVLAVLARIVLEPPPRLHGVRPDLPDALDALVASLLAPSPDGRPQSAAHLVASIDAITLAEAPDDRVRAPSSTASPALTHGERRLCCVILAGHDPFGQEALTNAATVRQVGLGEDLSPLRATAATYGGRLESFAGAALVALSGEGVATDLAARAARCALALASRLPGVPVALALGRAEPSAEQSSGEALERAAALLPPQPSPGEPPVAWEGVRLDPVIARLLEGRFEVRTSPEGPSLVGERDEPDAGRALLGRAVPCVGRERELATLEALWTESVTEERACVVVVRGAAGVGKSRLLAELLARRARDPSPPTVLLGRGDPVSAGSPFGLLSRALRRAAGVQGGEPLDAQRKKLFHRVARHVPRGEAPRVAEFLGELSGIPFAEHCEQLRAARADPQLMGDQMRRAWEDFLSAEVRAGPVLLVLEDLHWGDLPSVQLVDGALRALRDAPWMVLGLARPEVDDAFPRLWADRDAQALGVGELSRRSSERLVKLVLGDRADEALVASLVERAGGHPVFLEELVRAVAEGRGEALPDTAVAMVQGRIDALPPEARRVLRAASVFGPWCWQGAVATLLGGTQGGSSADEWLPELARRELVTRRTTSRFRGETEYAFRHALLREAAYATLTPHDARVGHALAGAWLTDAGETDRVALAEHFERGGALARAAEHYLAAARQALEGHDLAAALARAARGVACGAEGETLGGLRLVEAEALNWLADATRAFERGRDALAHLPPGSASWYRAAGEAGTALGRLGALPKLEAWLDEVRAVARSYASVPSDPETLGARITCFARALVHFYHAGRNEPADPLLAELEALAASAPVDLTVRARLSGARASRAVTLDDFLTVLAETRRALADYESAGDLRNATVQRNALGLAYARLGALSLAEPLLSGVLARTERQGLASVAAVARLGLARVSVSRGAWAEARLHARAAMNLFSTPETSSIASTARVCLAEAHAGEGDLASARREATQSAEGSATPSGARARALALLSRLALGEGLAAEAAVLGQRSWSLGEGRSVLDDGRCVAALAWSRALDALGDRARADALREDEARRLLSRAGALTREDPALTRGWLEDLPEHRELLSLVTAR